MSLPLTAAEVAAFRADTAGCRDDAIFLNNAGASLQPKPVVARVIEHLQLEEQVGGYEAARQVAAEHQAVYASVAQLVGASADEIAITESATRAWDSVFYAFPFKAGDRIVTAQNEYSSNVIAFLQMAKRTGAEITVVPSTGSGEIDLDTLQKTLAAGRVKLVALTHVATNNGMVQPAVEVGKLTRAHGVPFLLDACQSIGQMPIDVHVLGCDALSTPGRKYLRGPRGTGFLYVRRSLLEQLEPPSLDNHAATWSGTHDYTVRPDARRFESFESSLALTLGLGVAARYAVAIGLERIEARVRALAESLRSGLSAIGGVHVTDTGTNRSGIVIFRHERVSSASLAEQLGSKNISVFMRPQFETRLDEKLSAQGDLVRASIHYYNTEAEVERFCAALADLVKTV
jgi:selenocysteine lyase/cysteine desulfurase